MAILLMPCVKAPPEQVHLHLPARAETISARGSVSDTGTKGRRRAEPTGGGGVWMSQNWPLVQLQPASSKLFLKASDKQLLNHFQGIPHLL